MLSRRLLRIKALKTLYAHFNSGSESMIASEKNLLFSIDKTYELYHQMLYLIVDVANEAQSSIDLGLAKHLPTAEERNPNTKFLENKVVAALRNCDELTDYLDRKHLGWVNYPDFIKKLYAQFKESPQYQKYMESPTRSFKEDLKLVESFYINTVNDFESLESVLEDQSIMWSDDVDFVLIMVDRTLQSMKATQTKVEILPQYKSDDDRTFVKELFRKAVVNHKSYFDYIDKFTDNWDVERIAFMDNLIMSLAMAELLTFESIPVKVTLDEYIEIAKFYSTPNSGQFINGVMDKIVAALTAEGRLEKSGRGLI